MNPPDLPIVGHDLDGCHFPFLERFIDYVNERCSCDLHASECTQYHLEDLFLNRAGICEEECLLLLREFSKEAFHTRPPYEGAVEAFTQLTPYVFSQVIITARGAHEGVVLPTTVQEITRTWLEQHKYQHHGVYFTADKLSCAKTLGVTHMIEDHPSHSYLLAREGIQVYLIDQPYNNPPHEKDCERYNICLEEWNEFERSGRIVRVSSVRDAAQKIIKSLEERLSDDTRRVDFRKFNSVPESLV